MADPANKLSQGGSIRAVVEKATAEDATTVVITTKGPYLDLANRLSTSPSQLALAWLLRRSPVMLPIPGTSSVAHLEDNVAAAALDLSDDDVAELTRAAG